MPTGNFLNLKAAEKNIQKLIKSTTQCVDQLVEGWFDSTKGLGLEI